MLSQVLETTPLRESVPEVAFFLNFTYETKNIRNSDLLLLGNGPQRAEKWVWLEDFTKCPKIWLSKSQGSWQARVI